MRLSRIGIIAVMHGCLSMACAAEMNDLAETEETSITGQSQALTTQAGSAQVEALNAFGTSAPVIVVNPPRALATSSTFATLYDASLLANLRIEACVLGASGACMQSVTVDAQAPNQLKLTNGIYQANVQLNGPAAAAYAIQARVIVGNLWLATLTSSEPKPNTSFTFVIQNDPRIRAHLALATRTPREVADLIVAEFGLDAQEVAEVLDLEQVQKSEIARVLRDKFALSADELLAIMVGLGTDASTLAAVLKDLYELDAVSNGRLLKQYAFGAPEIYSALKGEYTIHPADAARLMADVGFSGRVSMRVTYADAAAFYESLVRAVGPVFKFHPEERFLPSTVDDYFGQVDVHDDQGGVALDVNRTNLHALGREAIARGAQDIYLNVPPGANLLGDLQRANAYIHVVRNDDTTDIQFWLFYPYNGPGSIQTKFHASVGFGYQGEPTTTEPLGEHYSDWETVVVRLDNTNYQVQDVRLSHHGDYEVHHPWEMDRDQGHFVVYPSLNGHANMAHTGDNPYHLAGGDIKIPEKKWEIADVTVFKIPAIDLGSFVVAGLNRAESSDRVLRAYDDGKFEMLGIYDSRLNCDHLAGADSANKHWSQFDGPWTQDWNLHMDGSTLTRIFFTQFQPLMDVVCTGGSFKSAGLLAGCDKVEGIDVFCDVVEDFLLSQCKKAVKPLLESLPQSWIDAVVGKLMGGIDAARPGSPGVRYCGYTSPRGSAAKVAQWNYQTAPNETCSTREILPDPDREPGVSGETAVPQE